MLQQLSQMEKHLHEARREHTKAVVALRQAERQTQREKTRSRETLRALEDAARTEEEQLGRRLQEAERDKNLMTATLRQEGLMKAYQRNRSAAVPLPDRESEHGQSPTEAQTLVPTSAHPAKESLSSMLANLQSLGAALLSDEEEGERLNL
ncbi:coiled-coil alpha-helical rod protein 1-like isoform X2 [Ascaphus truei]